MAQDSDTVVEHAHTVIKGLNGELALGVLVHGFGERRGGERDRGDANGGRGAAGLGLLEQVGDLAGDGSPAVLLPSPALLDGGTAHGEEVFVDD